MEREPGAARKHGHADLGGSAACEPVDLDWIVPRTAVGVDPLDPYPFVDRLVTALAPTFAAVDPAGEAGGRQAGGEYARHAHWLEPWIREYRQVLHRTSMRTVQKRMSAVGVPMAAAIVITRELLGPDRHSVDDARAVVFADPAWARLVDVYQRSSGWLDRELERLSE